MKTFYSDRFFREKKVFHKMPETYKKGEIETQPTTNTQVSDLMLPKTRYSFLQQLIAFDH